MPACVPLREIPTWCGNYGGGVVELANTLGWGKTCLPYTKEEIEADAACSADKLTNPVAVEQARQASEWWGDWWDRETQPGGDGADVGCLERHPWLYNVLGGEACKSYEGNRSMWLVFAGIGALALLMAVRGRR